MSNSIEYLEQTVSLGENSVLNSTANLEREFKTVAEASKDEAYRRNPEWQRQDWERKVGTEARENCYKDVGDGATIASHQSVREAVRSGRSVDRSLKVGSEGALSFESLQPQTLAKSLLRIDISS